MHASGKQTARFPEACISSKKNNTNSDSSQTYNGDDEAHNVPIAAFTDVPITSAIYATTAASIPHYILSNEFCFLTAEILFLLLIEVQNETDVISTMLA